MSTIRPTIAVSMSRTIADRMMTDDVWRQLDEVGTVLARDVIDDYDADGVGAVLAEVDLLLTGWEAPLIDAGVLARAPRLAAIVHAGGSVKHHVSPECWERGIAVSSAVAANAVAVAEFTLGAILLGNKHVFDIAREVRETRHMIDAAPRFPDMGNDDKVIGIVGASHIGRHLISLLRPFRFETLVYDPYLDAREAAQLGVTNVGLAELVARADVVTIHAPSLPETAGLLGEELIQSLRPGALVINTARGELIDQAALTRRLMRGDVFAVLDVVTPWDLPAESPLYDLRNVLLTPHIAGSMGTELGRIMSSAIREVARFGAGEPFAHAVTRDALVRRA